MSPFDYYTNAELEELEKTGDPNTVLLVSMVRRLSREFLLTCMVQLSKKYLQEDWAPDVEFSLWEALTQGAQRLEEDEIKQLDYLSEQAGGWWTKPKGAPLAAFVSFHEWQSIYEAAGDT